MMNRRTFLKASAVAGASMLLPWSGKHRADQWLAHARAATQEPGLSDPADQLKFEAVVPNALDPGFIFDTKGDNIDVAVGQAVQQTGLRQPPDANGNLGEYLDTTIWGYGDKEFYSWPGRTFEVQSGEPLKVKWENQLGGLPYLITGKDNRSIGGTDNKARSVVDTSLHWAYALHGYDNYTIEKDGVPIVAHLHGGHTDYQSDGNPEFFFSPGWKVRGPQWVAKKYQYDNDQPAGTLWYHDHGLGITRLNVYTGMAGFYILRDNDDTGLPDNPLTLPAWPYEAAFAIQDRMFKDTGEFFYPAFPGDPFYKDFITDEDAVLPSGIFPDGGPTGLAEFFGDHMVVNGKIWPKMDVERRNYRLRLLNGCDSRFLAIQFWEVAAGATDFSRAVQRSFTVIGSDQGLASSPTTVDTLLMETGSRYDIIFDFNTVRKGNRVIMKNIGGDEPFGGDIPGPQVFGETDRIMAFDVVLDPSEATVNAGLPIQVDNFEPESLVDYYAPNTKGVDRTRKVALFEGKDEFGRLQPLLGTAEPAKDYLGNTINWPETPVYENAILPDDTESSPLTGPMEGSIAWHSPTTENPDLGDTEIWEIWNATGDAHPVHLHLVHFDVLGRLEIKWDSRTDEDSRVLDPEPEDPDGTYLVVQPTVQHNSVAGEEATYGQGFRLVNLTTTGGRLPQPDGYVENAPKDMVTALPDQVTYIKATFDKPGRYVWHCHILSHEDHEMMRVLYVGPDIGGASATGENKLHLPFVSGQ